MNFDVDRDEMFVERVDFDEIRVDSFVEMIEFGDKINIILLDVFVRVWVDYVIRNGIYGINVSIEGVDYGIILVFGVGFVFYGGSIVFLEVFFFGRYDIYFVLGDEVVSVFFRSFGVDIVIGRL